MILIALFCFFAAVSAQTTYTVNTVTKTASHPFFNQGFTLGYTIDGAEGAEVTLTVGNTYIFDVQNSCSHPFYFTSSNVGVNVSRIDSLSMVKSVPGADVCAGRTITFTPTNSDIGTFFYQCEIHGKMGGVIKVEPSTAPAEISITVSTALKSNNHPEFGKGWPIGYALGGVEGRELFLTAGVEYTFQADQNCGHPVYITESATGGPKDIEANGKITDGVVISAQNGEACGGETLKFTPTASQIGKPLFYQCEIHERMGFRINVQAQSLCGKYSGALGISNFALVTTVVDATVAAVVGDNTLLPYFDGTNPNVGFDFTNDAAELQILKDKLITFFGQEGILSCRDGTIKTPEVDASSLPPATVSSLSASHLFMKINTAEFNAFNQHLLDVLTGAGVEESDVIAVGSILESTKPLICGAPDCDPNYVPSICDRYSAALSLSNFDLVETVVVDVFLNISKPQSRVADYFSGVFDCTTSPGGCNFTTLTCDSGTPPLSGKCLPDYLGSVDAQIALATSLVKFFGQALGCTDGTIPPYSGKDMQTTHEFMPIGAAEFEFFNSQVVKSMARFGVEEADLLAVSSVLESLRFAVCNQPDCTESICDRYTSPTGTNKDLVEAVVTGTVTDVLAEATLLPYFDGTKPQGATDFTTDTVAYDGLFLDLVEFFGGALGCSDGSIAAYTGAELAPVHAAMQITPAEFDLFNRKLLDVLIGAGVGQADVDAVASVLESTRPAICQHPSCTAGNGPSRVIDVAVAPKSSHPEFGVGFSSGFTIDGVEGAKIFALAGEEILFNVPGTCFHPFYLTSSMTGGVGPSDPNKLGAAEGIDGTNSACDGNTITFTPVPGDVGKTYYYQCENHANMGWQIEIVDSIPTTGGSTMSNNNNVGTPTTGGATNAATGVGNQAATNAATGVGNQAATNAATGATNAATGATNAATGATNGNGATGATNAATGPTGAAATGNGASGAATGTTAGSAEASSATVIYGLMALIMCLLI